MTSPDEYTIRRFVTIEEYRECVDLQEETWGKGFSERVPPAILKVTQRLGGVSAGAYDAEGRLVGFVFGLTGVEHGRVVHWSDMLAVRPEARDRGLGARLKAYQRDELIRDGVDVMYWTFDPLQARNAYLNFSKLGIVVREYARDMYGQTDSPLHRGIGTDRFVALWLMTSDRVVRRLSGEERGPSWESAAAVPWALEAKPGSGPPLPGELHDDLDAPAVRVAVPADIGTIMDRDPALALAWREATRAALTAYMDRGHEVRELLRGDEVCAYLLQGDERA
ncbi:MAG: GNAT family N-acetyltransferase [Gemmatimonadota bacterium]|nr:GNAT family N-acetyltransferase [Gemmatimonadota bacterium]